MTVPKHPSSSTFPFDRQGTGLLLAVAQRERCAQNVSPLERAQAVISSPVVRAKRRTMILLIGASIISSATAGSRS